MEDEKHITKSAILERQGWSNSLIQKLLNDPDKRVPMYGRSGYYCLYKESRVIDAEQGTAFEDAQEALAKRKASSAKAVETKKAKLLAQVNEMQITVKEMSYEDLLDLAIDNYNFSHGDRDRKAYHGSDKDFLQRIAVNFIRHNLTQYDQHLWSIANKTGINDAVDLIREKVYAAISKTYPDFSEECERQSYHKLMQDSGYNW